MAKANAKATATTQTAPVKAPTKMQQSKELFDVIIATPAPEGKTHRGIFMEQAESIGLSKAAANTYFQNLLNEAKGNGRYAYSPASTVTVRNKKSKATTPAVTGLKDELKALATIATGLNKQINQLARRVA